VQLATIVEVSGRIAATRKRTVKIELLTDTLRTLTDDELTIGVAYLSGEPRQPRLDLGPSAVFGVEVSPAATSRLSLQDVDDTLQSIADVEAGSGSRTRRLDVLEGLLGRATEAEQRWLRSLIVRELRQGSLEGLLIAAIARAFDVPERAVRRAAMLSGDLRATARLARDGGTDQLDAVGLQVGVGIEPMLASTAGDLATAMADTGEVWLDAKLDGARVQVHRSGDAVRVFTRTLHDVTDRVPEVVDAALALDVEQMVLDGEAIAFGTDGRPRPFQETMQRFGRERPVDEARHDVPLTVRFFDLLHIDGQDLIDEPLHRRMGALDRIVPTALRMERLLTDDLPTASRFLRDTLAAGHEGVMVKDPGSPYEAGRRGAGWRKVKPVHTLDLVVIAAEWGSGRRAGWLSNLHLACRADGSDSAGLVMLGKTFKGLTDEVLTWQTEALLERETHRDGHVVHVRPELVVEIAFDGLVRSTRYPGGLALRFARVRGYRPDKSAAAADTLSMVRAIHAGARLPDL
jgi:DNA ligase 1